MVADRAVWHHGERWFVFEEQQGDGRMESRYAGFWCMGLYLYLRKTKIPVGFSTVKSETSASCSDFQKCLQHFGKGDLKVTAF